MFFSLFFVYGIVFLAEITLEIFMMSESYSKKCGDIGFDQFGDYISAGFVGTLLFAFIGPLLMNLSPKKSKFSWLSFGIISIFYLYIPLSFLSSSGKEQMLSIARKNWRIDKEYVIFEMKNKCNGLEMQGDVCNKTCCDKKYESSFNSLVTELRLFDSITILLHIFHLAIVFLF